MSLNSLTQDQLYHRRAYQLHVMREEANEQAAKYVDKRCTKVGDLVVLVLRVALPAIMIVSATLPHFITGVAWFPFAAIGSMAVLIIFQTMFLEPYLFWKKKKGEAYFNLRKMLKDPDHYRLDSLYPVTKADLPKDKRWLSDLVEPDDYMCRLEKTYPPKSSRHLNLMTGHGMPVTCKQKKRSVIDIETTLPLTMIAAGQISSIEDMDGRKMYKPFSHEIKKRKNRIKALQKKLLGPGQQNRIKALQKKLLGPGQPEEMMIEANLKWKIYLDKNKISENQKKQLNTLDEIELEYGYASIVYKEKVRQFRLPPAVNRERQVSLKKRCPLYRLEEELYHSLREKREEALKVANPISEALIKNSSQRIECEKVQKSWERYVRIAFAETEEESALLKELNELDNIQIDCIRAKDTLEKCQSSEDKSSYEMVVKIKTRIYRKALKELTDSAAVLNPVRSLTLAKRKGLPVKKIRETRYHRCKGLSFHVTNLFRELEKTFDQWASLPPYFETKKYDKKFEILSKELEWRCPLHLNDKDFKEFVDHHERLEAQLIGLAVQMQGFQKILEDRIKNDVGTKLERAQLKLYECDRVIRDQAEEVASLESVPEAILEKIQKRRSSYIDLKTKLDKIEEKLKGIVSYEKSHKVVEELNVLMIKQILPFHREIHGVKKISILPLVKKAAFNEVPEKMQRAFWPKKMKIKRVKDENVNLFSKKQEQIDRQIANEDFKIQVAHRMHLLVLGGIAQFTLLILTGVFFFWYPNTWMMVALTCSDYAIAVSRLGIEFWFSYHNRKRILQMQRYLAQHPDGVPIPGNRLDINRLYKVQQKYGLIDVSATDARMRVEGSIVFKKQPIGKIKIKLNCAEQKEMEFFSKLEENRRLKVLYEKNKSELEADEENREAKLLNNSKKYKLILLEMIIHQCDVSSDHVLFNKAKRAIQESSFCEPKVLESVDQEISDFTEIEAMIRVNKQGKTIELFKEIEIKVPAIKELKDALGLIADNGRMCGDKQLLEFRILELENEEKNRIIPGNYLAKIHHRRKLDIESHRINTILPMEADVLKKEAEKLRACLYSQKIPRF